MTSVKEDGGVRADAEREGQHHRAGQVRGADQRAHRSFQVAEKQFRIEDLFLPSGDSGGALAIFCGASVRSRARAADHGAAGVIFGPAPAYAR
jgi:hypothetical protein